MVKIVNKLTDLKCRKAGPALHPDGDGLYLQVRGPTAKSWVYRYMRGGSEVYMGLGSYPSVTLETARQERDKWKRVRQAGHDPKETRDRERAESRVTDGKAFTFTEAAAAYIRDKAPAWRNDKHKQQWSNTLNTYVNPMLGNMPVRDIDTAAVKAVLDPIWATKTETATRVRQRIEAILDWSKALGYRNGDNPARWRGNLKELLANPSDVAVVEHHPSVPYPEIPALMEKLRSLDNVAARAMEWLILTGVRVNEALGMMPNEINHSEGTWTIPKIRMKSRRGKARDHRVPLPARAFEILDALPRDASNPHIFQGVGRSKRMGKPLSDGALLALLDRIGYGAYTTHGMRASLRTWAGERTNIAREVIEKALSHVVGDETERAYDRGDLFERRRQLMEQWAEYCASKPGLGGANVVPLKSAG
jgi:integrase